MRAEHWLIAARNCRFYRRRIILCLPCAFSRRSNTPWQLAIINGSVRTEKLKRLSRFRLLKSDTCLPNLLFHFYSQSCREITFPCTIICKRYFEVEFLYFFEKSPKHCAFESFAIVPLKNYQFLLIDGFDSGNRSMNRRGRLAKKQERRTA